MHVRRVVLILLSLTVMVPSVAMGATFYRCGHTGTLRDHCCCAHGHAKRTETRAAIKAPCCCETVHVAAAQTPSRQAPAPSPPAGRARAVIVAIATVAAPVRHVALVSTREAVGPPGPLFVVHCALLI